jgi:hypothetical protein
VIAVDGNQSRDVDPIYDRSYLTSGVDGGHRFGDEAELGDEALLAGDEQAHALGRGLHQSFLPLERVGAALAGSERRMCFAPPPAATV